MLKRTNILILNFIVLVCLSLNLYGQTLYNNTKYIIYKKHNYKWTVQYVNAKDAYIFDTYEKYCKVK